MNRWAIDHFYEFLSKRGKTPNEQNQNKKNDDNQWKSVIIDAIKSHKIFDYWLVSDFQY